MAIKLIKEANYLRIQDTVFGRVSAYPSKDLNFIEEDGVITISVIYGNYAFSYDGVYTFAWTDAVDYNDEAFPSLDRLKLFLRESTGGHKTSESGATDVYLQDQTTPLFIGKMSREEAITTLAVATAIDDTSITVTDATGFVTFQYLSIFSVPENRFYLAEVTSVVGNVITLDTPLDFTFPIGAFVTGGDTNMNVNGSVTPIIYGLRNTEEAIGTTFHVTRILFKCLTTSLPNLSQFGNIVGGLDAGMVLRRVDGDYRNIFNVKTNADLKGIMYDFDIQSASGNQLDGFTGRLTFSGQEKIGVALELTPGEDLQMIIQDDLTTLNTFEVVVEGHEVE